jgi:Beta propeller domain
MTGRARWGVAAVAVTSALVVGGCTGTQPPVGQPPVVGSGGIRLAAFDSCDQALHDLRAAMLPYVGPYGLGGGGGWARAADAAGAAEAAPPAAPGPSLAQEQGRDQGKSSDQGHSSTNVHEAGVDEPDLVKTDGRRIVTVVDGTLRVIDTTTKAQSGALVLPPPGGADDLLLSGDHALVIRRAGSFIEDRALPVPGGFAPGEPVPGRPAPFDLGAQLLLVDLSTSAAPSIAATFTFDGRFVDARMVGQTVRVVAQSQPRFGFTYPTATQDPATTQRLNRDVVSKAGIDAWLPRYRLEHGGAVNEGRVDCSAVSRPTKFSATSMLTVLSFDLGASTLGTGDPVTIVADGNTVYGTATSLYVASDSGMIACFECATPVPLPPEPVPNEQPVPKPPQEPSGTSAPDEKPVPRGTPLEERTELYKFDISGAGKPRHVASGAVPGHLLNQYSLSEYAGHLRVATTSGGDAQSSVYVLDGRLGVVGKVGGLGKGERIYAVRFAGPVGYVVTFRQTDPLYTIDLRDPSAPRVAGELKITGYSAYLLPVGDGRVLGIGQEATDQGRTLGTQVSLFDVSDPAAPRRVAQYQAPGGFSEVEYDPHALLYWPPTGTVVLPVTSKLDGSAGAAVLRVDDLSLQGELPAFGVQPVRRALVTGETLWTVSGAGVRGYGVHDLGLRAEVGFG